jgi:hypothetical protein
MQLVVFVLDHVNVDVLPETTVVGLATSETVGAELTTSTLALAEALPPLPLHFRV